MKLYYRDTELKMLRRQLWLSREQRSRMTVLSGRFGSGKSALLAEAFKGEPLLYFRLSGKTESVLLLDFIRQVREKLGLYVPSKVLTLKLLMEFLFDSAHKRCFTVAMDKFDTYASANPDFPLFLRELWDANRSGTHINLILVTSNPLVDTALFRSEDSPLRDLPDTSISLSYFTTSQIKSLMASKGGSLTNTDLLTLYMCTGGMPALVCAALERTDGSAAELLTLFLSPDSPLGIQASRLLGEVLGKNAETYLSILQLISRGVRSQSELEDQLGGMIIGGHLAKLEAEYQLVTKARPLLSGKASRNVVRYYITDRFLDFWLRNIESSRTEAELGDWDKIRSRAEADMPSVMKDSLVGYFMQKFAEARGVEQVGGDWTASARQSRSLSRRRSYYLSKYSRPSAEPVAKEKVHEIDIVALEPGRGKALVADVCLTPGDFEKKAFLDRLATLKKGPLKGYVIDSRVFTLDDM
ncbi:MAG: ATP-binding protein [Bacteroidales bacterium]|nr:ATP-binding protein [Bacteroidales bacterium]